MRSITVPDSSFCTLPTWARFAVRFCLDHRVDRAGGNAIQLFTTRAMAERWARVTMRALPKTYDTNSAPRVWALVYAMPDTCGRNLNPALHAISNAQCYLAIDNGGKVAKRHTIALGYHGHKRGDDPEATSIVTDGMGLRPKTTRRYVVESTTTERAGRPVAERWGVVLYLGDRRAGWALRPQDDESDARTFAATCNAGASL